jgi:glutaredoxin 3
MSASLALALDATASENRARVTRFVAKVEIYTTSYCPYCFAAKALLERKGVSFVEIEVGYDGSLREAMTKRAGGRRTVPEIFINDRIIGGYDELRALEARGELDALLTESP